MVGSKFMSGILQNTQFFAKKEADGYPDPTNMFYGKAFGDLPSTDVVLPGKLYEVIVRLGPKAGRIVGAIY